MKNLAELTARKNMAILKFKFRRIRSSLQSRRNWDNLSLWRKHYRCLSKAALNAINLQITFFLEPKWSIVL